MKDFVPINHWIKTHGDLALDLVRIYLGVGLIIKAVFFVTHMDYLLNTMSVAGSWWFAPAMLAHYVVLAHFCGGVCLLLGLFTRTAALVQLPILFSAIFYVHLPHIVSSMEARQSVEFAGLVFFLLCLISVYGAGRWSMDHWLAGKQHEKLFETHSHVTKPA
jgi:putative oxidoreductase